MAFATEASEVGQGIGGFLGPIFGSLGSDVTTQTTQTEKPSSNTGIIIIAVIVVIVITGFLLFRKKPVAAPIPAPKT